MRAMIDSMIFDRIAGTPGMSEHIETLITAGDLTILTTHLQEDELAKIPDDAKREAIARLPREQIPTYGMALDDSRLDMARLSEGEGIEEIRRGNVKNTEDSLIAATADVDADILVTEDSTFTKRAGVAFPKLKVWKFEHFCDWILQHVNSDE